MESYEVLKQSFEAVGVKKVAAELHLSQSVVYKWCLPPETETEDGSGTRNPLDRLKEILKVTGDNGVVQWLCQQAGGFFVPNPVAQANADSEVLRSTQVILKEFSELLAEVSKSFDGDQAISPKEAGRIRTEWEQLKTRTEEFVVACEAGVFEGD